MPIQEFGWWAVSGDLECPMCRNLGDAPGVKLEKSSRLHSTLDGYALYEFSCKECGWKSGQMLVLIESRATAPEREKSSIVLPSPEEVERVNAKPAQVKAQLIQVPQPKPVDLDELHAYVTEKFPLELRLGSDKVVKRKIERVGLEDGSQTVVKVIYSEGNSTKSEFGFNYAERTFFCLNGFPDVGTEVQKILMTIGADLKVTNPKPGRVTAQVVLNAARSKLRTQCSQCGSTDGDCGCPGMLKNVRNPAGMSPPTTMLQAPDGSPVQTLQDRLDPGSKYGV